MIFESDIHTCTLMVKRKLQFPVIDFLCKFSREMSPRRINVIRETLKHKIISIYRINLSQRTKN